MRPPESPEHRRFSTQVLHRRWLSARAFELTLSRPKGFDYRAGQFLRFQAEDLQRDYSLVSAPSGDNLILCVRYTPGGRFSPFLAGIPEGDMLEFTGPHGYFTYHTSPDQAVFVATGTGIAPFVSYARAGARGYILLHGVHEPDDLYYRKEMAPTALEYIPCLSRPFEGRNLPDACAGHVTQCLLERVPEGPYTFYLCGRREMIRDITYLIDDHFPGSLVYSESYN